MNYLKTFYEISEAYNKPRAGGIKYKKSINCSNPKGKVDKDELKSFTESYLAYLMDEGFQVGINLDRHEDDRSGIDLHLFRNGNSFNEVDPYGDDDPFDLFYWQDVKEHFIPFMKMFTREYSFSVLKLYSFYGAEVRTFTPDTWSFDQLLNDNFEVPEELREVKICNTIYL